MNKFKLQIYEMKKCLQVQLLTYFVYTKILTKYYNLKKIIIKSIYGNFNLIYNIFLNRIQNLSME